MAKLFVSCPMRGRTERQIHDTISQLCDIAEAIFNEKFEVIDTWIAENAPASNHEVSWKIHSAYVGSRRLYRCLR